MPTVKALSGARLGVGRLFEAVPGEAERPLGLGFCVPGGLLITCAHVVADVEQLLVRFDFDNNTEPVPAKKVLVGFKHPEADQFVPRHDVAVLSLEARISDALKPGQLVLGHHQRRGSVVGGPVTLASGYAVTGEINYQELSDGTMVITTKGKHIDNGWSGGAVVVEDEGHEMLVVGMVAGRHGDPKWHLPYDQASMIAALHLKPVVTLGQLATCGREDPRKRALEAARLALRLLHLELGDDPNVEAALVEDCYRQALESRWTPRIDFDSGASGLRQVIPELASMGTIGEASSWPLYVFAEAILPRVNHQPRREELSRWLEDARAKGLGSEKRSPVMVHHAGRSSVVRVQVRISVPEEAELKGPISDQSVEMSVRLTADGNSRSLGCSRAPLGRCGGILSEALKLVPRFAANGAEVSGLVVEFIVPWQLLQHDFESWRLRQLGQGVPVGVTYATTLRCEDRYTSMDLLLKLKRKWDLLTRQRCEEAVVEYLHLHESAEPHAGFVKSTCSVTQRQATLAELRGLLVGAVEAPAAKSDSFANHFRAMISAGTPIVLWRRAGEDEEGAFEAWVRRYCQLREWRSLGSEVLEARKQADWDKSDEAHFGRHLGLILDDPTTLNWDLTNPLSEPEITTP